MNLFAWYWSFCVVIGVLYTTLIVWFLNGWNTIPVFVRSKNKFSTKVSVLVPFYNEETCLKECVEGLIRQNIQTTEYEIILIDDQSNDGSVKIAKDLAQQYRRVNYLRNNEKGKKQALNRGIGIAQGDLIVCTDADCIHNENWLATMVEYYEQYHPNMIVGPVMFAEGSSLLQKFQKIEFSSLVATSAGAIGIGHGIMCNGANLAFNKQVFNQFSNPFHVEYTSGDDVFLLHNMKTIDSDQIHFLKSSDVVVLTQSIHDLKAFFKQRFRWVSKAPGYSDTDTKFTAIVVLVASLLWVLGLAFMVYDINFWKPLLFMFGLKTVIDGIFLCQTASFFANRLLLKWIPLFQVFYGFYVLISGMSLLFVKRKI